MHTRHTAFGGPVYAVLVLAGLWHARDGFHEPLAVWFLVSACTCACSLFCMGRGCVRAVRPVLGCPVLVLYWTWRCTTRVCLLNGVPQLAIAVVHLAALIFAAHVTKID